MSGKDIQNLGLTKQREVVLDDFSGEPRPSGAYDIGAHEGALTASVTLRAPDGLSAVSTTPGRVNLSWTDPNAAEDGFAIERSGDGKTFTVIGTTGPSTLNFTDTTASKGKTYTYRVAAIAVAATSAYSNTASVFVLRR